LLGNRWVALLVAAVFFAVAFLILYQQEATIGVWFQPEQLHHETFAITSIALGIGVLIGWMIGSFGQRRLGFTLP
jgi:hypothetical protein